MSSKKEMKDLYKILELLDAYIVEHGFNPFDNYAYREMVCFDYLKNLYPTMQRTSGRHGFDGSCDELGFSKIEMKSRKVKPQKKKGLVVDGVSFDFDMREQSAGKTNSADSFLFAIFSAYKTGAPAEMFFISESKNVGKFKRIVKQYEKEFNKNPKGRQTISIPREKIVPLADKII